jgi:capsule polysaccharide export protein KpsE/RkpR
LDSIFKQKDAIINKLRERFIEELVSPLEEEIDDIIKNKSKREQELQSYQHKLDDLLKVRALIDEQLQIIENIKE